MKTKHTLAPWTIKEDTDERDRPFIGINAGGRAIADMCGRKGHVSRSDWEQTEANARLIAAAPELVAALKGCVELVGDFIESFRAQLSPAALAGLKAKLQPARAALEKAGRGVEGGVRA